MSLTRLIVCARALQVTYDPFERKHPPTTNRAIQAKIVTDKERVEVVGAETLGRPEFLQHFKVILDIPFVFLDMHRRYTVRGCPADCSGEQQCTVHQFGPIIIRLCP